MEGVLELRLGKLGTLSIPITADGDQLCGGLGTVSISSPEISEADMLGYIATVLVEWLDLVDASFDFDAGPEYSAEDGIRATGLDEDDEVYDWDEIDPETGEVIEKEVQPARTDLDHVRAAVTQSDSGEEGDEPASPDTPTEGVP